MIRKVKRLNRRLRKLKWPLILKSTHEEALEKLSVGHKHRIRRLEDTNEQERRHLSEILSRHYEIKASREPGNYACFQITVQVSSEIAYYAYPGNTVVMEYLARQLSRDIERQLISNNILEQAQRM